MIREAVVKGKFYPADKKDLESFISENAKKNTPQISTKGAIMPHAGYVYSGKVAIAVAERIIPKKRVIILGPNHTGLGQNFSIYPEGIWKTPLGEITVDEEMVENIAKDAKFIKKDALAHKFEHSIEVQLPILQYFFKNDFKLTPIVCSTASTSVYKNVAEEIYKAVRNFWTETIIIATTDMTHYEPDDQVRHKDQIAIEEIVAMNVEELNNKAGSYNISMCGIAGVSIMIYCLKMLKVSKAKLVMYQTSADTNHDVSAAVGYAGFIFN